VVIVGMSIRSMRVLGIFCCRRIWSDYSLVEREMGRDILTEERLSDGRRDNGERGAREAASRWTGTRYSGEGYAYIYSVPWRTLCFLEDGRWTMGAGRGERGEGRGKKGKNAMLDRRLPTKLFSQTGKMEKREHYRRLGYKNIKFLWFLWQAGRKVLGFPQCESWIRLVWMGEVWGKEGGR